MSLASAGSLFPSRRRRYPTIPEQETTTSGSPIISGRPGSPGRPSMTTSTVSVSQPSAPPEKFSTVTLPSVTPVTIMTTPRAVHINNSTEKPQTSEPMNPVEPEINAKNVDTELLSYGYVPINKVLLGEGSTEQRIKYIKAYNPYGELVYILLDGEGMCQGNLCTTMTEVASETTIPYTLKMTAAECNNLDVCAIIFECEQGVCALHRKKDNPVEFDEQLFVHNRQIGTPGRDFLRNKTVALPYPVVRLSEIRVNPERVLIASDESFKRMRNEFYKISINELNETNKLYNRLSVESKKFQTNAEIFSKSLMNDVIQLENLAEEHRSINSSDKNQKQNYKLVLINLKKRHEFLEEYLRYIDYYSQSQNTLNSMIEDLNKLNLKMETTINKLGKVLSE